MRFVIEKERRGYLVRYWHRHVERAWLSLRFSGLECSIETPSDWHEDRLAWLHVGLLFFKFGVSVPWNSVVPDEGQCSGPRYGFQFLDDILWIYYGKDTGRSKDPKRHLSFYMPWHWRYRWHKEYPETKETHLYHYCLKNWTVQERTATIQVEERLWTRFWVPWRRLSRSINVQFSDEVGERTGSWKGGTIGCGYEMLKNETPLECLRRMEQERKF